MVPRLVAVRGVARRPRLAGGFVDTRMVEAMGSACTGERGDLVGWGSGDGGMGRTRVRSLRCRFFVLGMGREVVAFFRGTYIRFAIVDQCGGRWRSGGTAEWVDYLSMVRSCGAQLAPRPVLSLLRLPDIGRTSTK